MEHEADASKYVGPQKLVYITSSYSGAEVVGLGDV
jgi:hypothetical protein